jgi:phosphotransacetylase
MLLEKKGVDFEFEGEMAVDVALNAEAQKSYPFSRLTGPANVLVVPCASLSVYQREVDARDGGGYYFGAYPDGR